MSRIKVVFFDAAGTLFHVKGSVAEVYLAYAEPYGVRRTPELLEAVNAAFRRAFRDAPPPIFAVTEPADIKRCERLWWFDVVHNVFYRVGMFEGFDEYFESVFQAFAGPQHWALCADTLGALKALKEDGYELGIISNFDTRLFSVLRGLGIADLFDTVTIASLAKAVKPAPRIFHLALDQHAVDPEEALHVGDSFRDDVEGARKAGLAAVLIDRGQASDRIVQDATPMIQTLDELPRLLATL
ncbi:MAG: HAD family hydrolase [Nitrospirae bacterium]|nr:MAG: HAD family hydrolase [Nitrospirota bacterium]